MEAQYQQAMAWKEAGLTEEAMAALENIGTEAAKAALSAMRMEQAEKLKEADDYEGAARLYDAEDSAEAKAALSAMRMEQAAELAQAGKYEEAAQLYAAESGEEAKALYLNCLYQLAQQLYENGDLPGAAEAFHELGDYEDAASRSEECYNEYYGQVAQSVRDLHAAQDYVGVIAALRSFEMNVLSQTYEDLPRIFAQACLAVGDQLYADGKPYEAMPYYQHAQAEEKLDRRAYLILGEWQSATGKTAVFRKDGTCSLMGEELCFRVSNFSLYTGASPESMTITHKISVLDRNGMSLRDQRNGQDVLYKFSRKGDFELPKMALPEIEPPDVEPNEPAPETAEEPVAETVQDEKPEMLVTEETDAPNE